MDNNCKFNNFRQQYMMPVCFVRLFAIINALYSLRHRSQHLVWNSVQQPGNLVAVIFLPNISTASPTSHSQPVTSTIQTSMHMLPTIGQRHPFINTAPRPQPKCLFKPSAYPIGKVAIRDSLATTPRRPYPMVVPSFHVFIEIITVRSVLTGFRPANCGSSNGDIPYRHMPRRTISN